ncbi:cache domain-containing protein [Paraglaciecola sp. 25GB23A]|uniref:hybrid sensor histidine kinase/response regulator n=2 Tax=Bacteria TaxID=2 RepID=UPI0032AF80AB
MNHKTAKIISSETYIAIMAVALVLIPLIVFSLLSFYQVSQSITDIIKSELQLKSSLLANDINHFMSERIINTKVISQADVLENQDLAAKIQYLTDITSANKWINDINIIDITGEIVASSGMQYEKGELFWTLYPIEKSLFISASKEQKGQVYVSKAMLLDKGPGVLLITPITDDSNTKLIGVLCVEVSLDNISEIVSVFKKETIGGKYVYILDNDGRVMISDDLTVKFEDRFPDLQTKSDLLDTFSLQDNIGSIIYIDHSGDEVMAGYADMAEFGENKALNWNVIVIAPMNEVIEPVNELKQLLLIMGGIIALLSMFLVYRALTFINNKLGHVAIQADAISQGDYSIKRLPESTREGAYNKLVVAINRMQMNIHHTLKSLQEQKSIFDQHSIVSMTDRAGLITYANDNFSNISGYSNQELIGENHRILNSGHHSAEFFHDIWKTISSGNIWQGEICNKAKNGNLYWVLSTLAPLFDSNGKVYQYISIRMDITKTKQTEVLLRRSHKMEAIGELTGGIAHDFNNLLGIIIGNHDLMKRKVEDGSKLQKQLNIAQNAALRGAELTRRLLNFSSQSEEQHSPVDLIEIINDYKDFISKSITASISLEIHITADIWQVDLDPGDFQDTLINLSLNARDAMPSGGTLIFEASNTILDHNMLDPHNDIKAGEYVKILVSDSGTGMNKETINKIFDPFFTTKDKSEGTGLGLAMVFGFVKRCKGSIIVYSEEGLGTTFTMYLPRSKSMVNTFIQSNEIDKHLPRGTETVLIVDDEAELLVIAQSVLDDLGYTTICASSGDEAREIITNNDTIDIVFSDIVMPGSINGFDLADILSTVKPGIKILLTSGFTGKMKQKESVARWASKLLSKPYRDLELAEAIRKTLDE